MMRWVRRTERKDAATLYQLGRAPAGHLGNIAEALQQCVVAQHAAALLATYDHPTLKRPERVTLRAPALLCRSSMLAPPCIATLCGCSPSLLAAPSTPLSAAGAALAAAGERVADSYVIREGREERRLKGVAESARETQTEGQDRRTSAVGCVCAWWVG